ncbi:hypothetical protein JCM3775_003610 [Rhodotorula graminis]
MVYYVCPNCGHRSDEYKQSMVHYNSCDTIRVRPFNSPPSSSFVQGSEPDIFHQGVAGVTSTNGGWNGGGAHVQAQQHPQQQQATSSQAPPSDQARNGEQQVAQHASA